MAYCTLADVKSAVGGSERLKQLSDYDKTNAIDVSVVESKIAEADAMINTKAQMRWEVDFSEVPPSIRFCSARLAAYYLRLARGALTKDDHDAYDRDILFLKELAEGNAQPGTSPLPEKSEVVRDSYTDRPTDLEVSRERMKGFA